MPVETPWTEYAGANLVYSLTASYPDHDGTLGTGSSSRLRARRANGEVQWAHELILGSSPSFPAGPLILPLGDIAVYVNPSAGGIDLPVLATYFDVSADPDAVSIGAAKLVYGTFTPVGGVGAQVIELFLYLWFASGQWSSTVPVAPAVGDTILSGNAIEAFDN